MKKILLVLLTIFYLSLSFVFMSFHFNYNLGKITHNNVSQISINNLNQNVKDNLELKKISNIAKDDNLNIFRVSYSPDGDIDLYFAVGNEKLFLNNYKIKFFKNKNINELYNENFFSNVITKNKSQIGYINIFQSKHIHIYSLEEMKNKPIIGNYFIEGKIINTKNIINQFKNIGLIGNSNLQQYFSANPIKSININLILGLFMLFIMVIISYLYYLVSKFKEVIVKRLFGFNSVEILKDIIIFTGKALCVSIFSSLIIQGIFILLYYNSLGICDYIVKLFILLFMTSIFIIIIFGISLIIFRFNNKVDMLKNKKPVNQLQYLNYTSKIISSFILVFILINTYNSFAFFDNEVKGLNKWKETKNYCYLNYSYPKMNKEQFCIFNDKNKSLFNKVDLNGILAFPSNGLQYGANGYANAEITPNFGQGTSMYSGNSIQVNSNYFKDNPIYYSNGIRVNIKENYGNYMIILVPEMYKKYKNQLLESYTKWYQFRKYANINVYDQCVGKIIPYEKPVHVEIKFIKDNQRTFLYNPSLGVKNNDYSINSCLAVINSENMGADSYMAYLDGGYFFINVKNGYEKLNKEINESDLSQYVTNEPNLYSRISVVLFTLKNNIADNVFIILSIMLLQIFIIIFSALNYTEKNKFIISIQKMHGYSFLSINLKFLIGIIINWIVVILMVMAKNIPFKYAAIPSLSLMILDIIISVFIMLILNKNTLKNVLNKE